MVVLVVVLVVVVVVEAVQLKRRRDAKKMNGDQSLGSGPFAIRAEPASRHQLQEETR